MNGSREVLFFPRSQRDLQSLDERFVRQILDDVELLRVAPWPAAKVKKLRGTQCWELKTGEFRTLFLPAGIRVLIARVVNWRDLVRTVRHFDLSVLLAWLREVAEED